MNKLVLLSFCASLFITPPQAENWTNRSPVFGGRLSGIVASPVNSNILIVSSPGGGIWRTVDGGVNWIKPANTGLADFTVLGLEWDVVKPGRLYAFTASDLYASENMGDSWTNLTGSGGYPPAVLTGNISADPAPFAQLKFNATSAYVLWSKPGSGLLYSNDGKTFKQHFPFAGGPGNLQNQIRCIGVDEATGYVYFATMQGNMYKKAALYRSTCAWTMGSPCLSWEMVNTGLPTNADVIDITYGKKPGTMVLCIADRNDFLGKIYTATDGKVWVPVPVQPVAAADVRHQICIAPDMYVFGAPGVFATTDGGKSWTDFYQNQAHSDFRDFYWGTYSSGSYLWTVTDGCISNIDLKGNIIRYNCVPGAIPSNPLYIQSNGLKTIQVYFSAVAAKQGISKKRVFLGTQDNNMFISDDGGLSWGRTGMPGGCGDIISMVVAPSNPDRAYVRSCNGSVIMKTDNAFSATTMKDIQWTTAKVQGGSEMPHRLWMNNTTAVDPSNADRVCIVRFKSIALSNDGGNQWATLVLPGEAQPATVMIDKDHSIYVGTRSKGIYRTADEGKTWEAFGLNVAPGFAVTRIVHTPAGGLNGTFYAATTSGLYRKATGGVFEFVNTGGDKSYTVSDVEWDPSCPKRIYIAKGFNPLGAYHRGGVSVSQDNGNTFTSITVGSDVHLTPVTTIRIDPLNPRYIHTSTYGLGYWVYDTKNAFWCQ